RDLEVDLAVRCADLQVDLVGQVEPPLGLDDVAEETDHVPVLAIELQLHVGLVALEVLGAHRRTSLPSRTAPSCPSVRSTRAPDTVSSALPTPSWRTVSASRSTPSSSRSASSASASRSSPSAPSGSSRPSRQLTRWYGVGPHRRSA